MIEYERSSQIVGKENILFTNIKRDSEKLKAFGKCEKKSVSELGLNTSRVCILDPVAEKTLSPDEVDDFDYFVIGGILGDEKFNGRTGRELTKFMPEAVKRNIGDKQFTIDNAVYVTHAIVNGKKLSEIKMQDEAEIEIKDGESIILPYTYPLIQGKPAMSDKLIAYLKHKRSI